MVKPAHNSADISPPGAEDLLFSKQYSHYRLCLWLEHEGLECYGAVVFDDEVKKAPPDHPVADSETGAPAVAASEVEAAPLAPPAPESFMTPPDLIWALQKSGILQTIDYAAVYTFCAAVELRERIGPALLARGVEPVSGADGWFEFTVKTSGDEFEFHEDETGRLDLRTLNAYSEIEPEQKLGIIHKPGPGTPGMTVQGLPLAAKPGRPLELSAGEGVILKYGGRMAFAEKSGRALLNNQVLSVVDELLIAGDVNLSVGNINFKGFVEVRGDVLDDFDIRSTEGIKVNGHIGACRLESCGPIEIVSMSGRENGEIICRGELRAKFLNQVSVLSYGDIFVSHEIRNSQVKSTGQVVVERGSIIGGHCLALKGIEAKNIGTRSGQKTRVSAGAYFPDADRFAYLHDKRKETARHIAAIRDAVVAIEKLLLKDTNISAAAGLRLSILNEQLQRLTAEQQRYEAEIAASTPQILACRNPKINVLTALLEGAIITLGQTTEEVRFMHRGPLSIIENADKNGLLYLGYSPLRIPADATGQENSDH